MKTILLLSLFLISAIFLTGSKNAQVTNHDASQINLTDDTDANEETSQFSNTSWDDGDDFSEEDEVLQKKETEEKRRLIEENNRAVHQTGIAVLVLYLSGLFFTLFFFNNHPLRKKIIPELLLPLHIFWFVEILLYLFVIKKKS